MTNGAYFYHDMFHPTQYSTMFTGSIWSGLKMMNIWGSLSRSMALWYPAVGLVMPDFPRHERPVIILQHCVYLPPLLQLCWCEGFSFLVWYMCSWYYVAMGEICNFTKVCSFSICSTCNLRKTDVAKLILVLLLVACLRGKVTTLDFTTSAFYVEIGG